MTTTLKLRECPFCGEDDAEMEREGTPRQSCAVRCGYCGASIEGSETGGLSGSTWNQRAYDADVAAYALKVDKLESALAASEARAERAERAVAEIHLQVTILPASREATDLEAFSVRRLRAIDPSGSLWKQACDDHKAWREFIAIKPGPNSPAATLDAPAPAAGTPATGEVGNA